MTREAALAAARATEIPGALLCFGCGEMVPQEVWGREPGAPLHWNEQGGCHPLSSEWYPEDGRVRRIEELLEQLTSLPDKAPAMRLARSELNPWLLLTKYRIRRCRCIGRRGTCGKWNILDFTTGESVYPHEWDSWAQALDEVQRRQARQYHGFTSTGRP